MKCAWCGGDAVTQVVWARKNVPLCEACADVHRDAMVEKARLAVTDTAPVYHVPDLAGVFYE